jgi:outer membrane protein TolC
MTLTLSRSIVLSKALALLLSLTFSTSASLAQAEQLSRATVIGKALQRSAQVAAARARRDQSQAEQTQADSARWPQVSLDVGVGPSLRAELVPGTASQSTRGRYELAASDLSVVVGGRLSVVQPLYTFGKIDAFRAAAAHGVRARDAQTEMTRSEVAVAVACLYEALLFARDAQRFFEELEHQVERTILSTQERVTQDDAENREQDVLRLQTALAVVRLSLSYARAGQEQARAGLVAYLGLSPTTPFGVKEDELKPLLSARADAARLVEAALRRRPELVALEQGALAYDSLATAERAGALPDVFLMAFADGAYTPGRDLAESRYVNDPLYHFDPGLLLGMRWQIQGAMDKGRGEQRKAQAHELRELQTWAVAGLPAQVRAAFADMQRARRDLIETHLAVERAKRWMIQANRDYLVGLADSQALVDAVRAYAELRAAELEATFRHNSALAQLAYATGTILDDRLGLYPGKEAP